LQQDHKLLAQPFELQMLPHGMLLLNSAQRTLLQQRERLRVLSCLEGCDCLLLALQKERRGVQCCDAKPIA
jgi:hypothetical protein